MAVTILDYPGIAFYRTRRTQNGRAFVMMVGDDRVFEVDAQDVKPIKRKDYCSECGQIGCHHDGTNRR